MNRVKTLIVATLGPASSNPTVLRKMIRAGLDVVRLNFSHGKPEEHRARIRLVRDLNRRMKRRLRILADLEGPRIRVGDLPDAGLALERGKRVRLVRSSERVAPGDLPIDYEGSLLPAKSATEIFIDDGNIALEILSATANRIEAKVRVGGTVKRRKGINIPDARLAFPLLSDHDAANIDLACEEGVDFIAQSFVRSPREVEAIRKHVAGRLPNVKLVAKIENREGVDNLEKIMDAADGLMVARGDLGVCLPPWEVPFVQKEMIARARKRRRFVITATQMLESMTANPRPTRAEVSDVANAVLDGTDYVMLSAESAVGKYPVKTVTLMNRILIRAEEHLKGRR
jgi:pyruvate kinase